jgi:hypothetical protein
MPDQPLNPYQPPAATTDVDPGTAFDLTRAEIEAFVGADRADYYQDRWLRARPGSFLVSWNWAAAFFNLMWLLYRRMFKEFFIALVLAILLGGAESLVAEYAFGGDFERELSRLGNIVLWAVGGLVGNGLYLRRARLSVARARAQIPEESPGRLAYLGTLGGTSWVAVVIGLVGSIALGFAAAQIPD